MDTGRSGVSRAESLAIQIEGTAEDPDRVLELSRPRGGLVEIREWSLGCGGTPREYSVTTEEFLRSLEQLERSRRRMTESLYAVRLWLGEAGP